MNDSNWFALAIFFGISPLAGAVVYLAHRVRGPEITVQAPTAIIPDEVRVLLAEINEKLHPKKPVLSLEEQEAALSKIIVEATLVAEQFAANNAANGHVVTGAEKQREAMRYCKQRAAALNIDTDYAVIAGRLESQVRKTKENS